MPRIPKTPLLLGAGLLSAGLLGLTGTGTLSAITAQITNSPNSAAFGRLVMELTDGAGHTCTSSSGTGNSVTCNDVQPLTGRGDLLPGTSYPTTVTAKNTGTITPSSFTLVTAPCVATGTVTGSTTQAAKDDICSKVSVRITGGGVDQTFTAADLGGNRTFSLTPPAPNATVPVVFTVSAPSDLPNAYQGLGVSVPMTWTFSQ